MLLRHFCCGQPLSQHMTKAAVTNRACALHGPHSGSGCGFCFATTSNMPVPVPLPLSCRWWQRILHAKPLCPAAPSAPRWQVWLSFSDWWHRIIMHAPNTPAPAPHPCTPSSAAYQWPGFMPKMLLRPLPVDPSCGKFLDFKDIRHELWSCRQHSRHAGDHSPQRQVRLA